MIRLIQYSVLLTYLAASVFLPHVNGAVCKAKSNSQNNAVTLSSAGGSLSETSAKPVLKTDASSSPILPGLAATPAVLAEVPQWQGGGPPCPPFLTDIKWDVIDAQIILRTEPDGVVRLSGDRMCCMGRCESWSKADGTTITTTWANTFEAAVGFEPKAAVTGLFKSIPFKPSFKDSVTYTYAVATSQLTTSTCDNQPPLAGKNCQAVLFQPYVLRVQYNATVTQRCGAFSDNDNGPPPAAPIYLYNKTVDIPLVYSVNGKDGAPYGVNDCWGDCLAPDVAKPGCEANKTAPSASGGSSGGNTVTINGDGNNVTCVHSALESQITNAGQLQN
ncbi:uncharacterized protein LOC62_02G001961 [Vanrija pseudolonga]|uniref:Uncharacterized protein n=1 Tax=Vanrija pseudolonga TaxID=143232 RepID=A0AAF0Y5H4_9TREE|nr:hypothetical protein LOC62_02G001961 [Vanrija pseudolonga]